MKNKIEIGSRWRSVGRNLPSYEGVVKMVTHKNDFIYLLRDGDDMSAPYDKYFFLANFEPIKDETVRGFKVGDKVKVEFDGVVKKISKHPLDGEIPYVVNFWHGEMKCLSEHLTLLESAKADLAVGQVWECETQRYKRRILMLTETTVFYDCDAYAIGSACCIDEFYSNFAHKLISEAGDE